MFVQLTVMLQRTITITSVKLRNDRSFYYSQNNSFSLSNQEY